MLAEASDMPTTASPAFCVRAASSSPGTVFVTEGSGVVPVGGVPGSAPEPGSNSDDPLPIPGTVTGGLATTGDGFETGASEEPQADNVAAAVRASTSRGIRFMTSTVRKADAFACIVSWVSSSG